jgi:hypothetical protein
MSPLSAAPPTMTDAQIVVLRHHVTCPAVNQEEPRRKLTEQRNKRNREQITFLPGKRRDYGGLLHRRTKDESSVSVLAAVIVQIRQISFVLRAENSGLFPYRRISSCLSQCSPSSGLGTCGR